MKAIRVLAALVVIAGACLTGRALFLHAKAMLAGVLIRRAWQESIGTGKPHAPWPWADTYPVARLRIPRLEYDEIVLEGATPRTLAFGPARVLSWAALGGPGNLMLAGHRTSWFRPLQGILRGDTLRLDWFDRQGRLRERLYSVDAVQVVEPEDVVRLMPTTEDSLTLITCYPFGRSPRSPQRFLVRALPLEKEAVETETTNN